MCYYIYHMGYEQVVTPEAVSRTPAGEKPSFERFLKIETETPKYFAENEIISVHEPGKTKEENEEERKRLNRTAKAGGVAGFLSWVAILSVGIIAGMAIVRWIAFMVLSNPHFWVQMTIFCPFLMVVAAIACVMFKFNPFSLLAQAQNSDVVEKSRRVHKVGTPINRDTVSTIWVDPKF